MPRFKKKTHLSLYRKCHRKGKLTEPPFECEMASRKSSRVKKSPVVYQAPEPTHRAPRNVTPKQPPPRRSFSRDIELQMECVEDELSPAQLKAIKEAQKEHEKANDLIKEVRAGNILVPSSQPNTFTIVPPKPSPTQPPPAAPIVQSSVMKSVSPPVEPTVPRGLPPPRPAQFLNKQLQEMNKTQARLTSDVILISDTPTMPGITKVPVSQVSTSPMQIQQMAAVIPSQGVSATPQQVYKFVSVPSNMPTNVVQNQWALRPLLTVSPQQQQQQSSQLSFLQTTRGVTQFTPMRSVALPQGTAPMPAPRSTVVSASASQLVKSTELAGKRPATGEPASAQPPAKKKNPKITEVPDQSGNWVPLDEYYYGTHEGDVSYTEEKGEYRFKCWYCSKMLYNNIRAMQHIQGHIDASKQQNIDLSDLTQCKHCYKQFDTPFEMQTHVEKVHLSNKVLMCRICEKDFATPRELMTHMKGNHHACEMPYVCHLCNFRSSMYSDVVDHFKKKHDSSHFMLCLYCLRTFEVKFVSQGWGQTQTYYGHLLKHQSKSATKKCVVCRLTFFNAMDVKSHRKTCHVTSLQDMKALSQGGKSDAGQKQKNRSTLKSLNAPSISRIQDYGDITFPAETTKSKCIECKMMMSSTDHYKKYVHCTMCRFATSCSVAYANHMMGFHSGQMSSLNLNIPWERPMKDIMYCTCGFSSKYGNKVANHLVYCAKWTCSSTKQTPLSSTPGKTGDEEKEGSLLGMLGLVQKSAVATNMDTEEIRSVTKRKTDNTEIRTESRGKTDSKPDVIVLDKTEKDTNKSILDTKPEDKNVEKVSESGILESTGEIPETDDGKTLAMETGVSVVKITSKVMEITDETITKETDKMKEKIDSDSVSKKDGVEVLKTAEEETTQDQKAIDDKEEGKEEKAGSSKMEDSQINEDVAEKPGAESEEEFNNTEKEEETETNLPSSKLLSDANAVEVSEEDTDARELVLDKEVVDETTTASEHSNSEAVAQTKLPPADIKPESDTDSKDDDLKGDKKDKDEEINMETGAVESVKESKELADESSDLKDLSAKIEDEKEIQLERETEMSLSASDKNDDEKTISEAKDESKSGTVEEILKENEEDTKTEGQESDVAQEKLEDLAVDQEESVMKDERDVEDGESRSSPAGLDTADHDDGSKGRSANDSRESNELGASGDDHSRTGRHHSGSGDRSKSGDNSHEDERQYHDNRSHGSSRSESHHGNRSSNERDRSYDRDRERDSRERDRNRDSRERDRNRDRNRDRDYNRNRDYRHGDRSGYSYQDNRGQGYSGGGGYRGPQGQYGGYQGNRGDNYQDRNRGGYHDRNYNRNNQNRGGYNQNYRGGYRGGYY